MAAGFSLKRPIKASTALPLEAREEPLAGWVLGREVDAWCSGEFRVGKPQAPVRVGCAACSHRGLVWLDLELFMDLHFLVEHLNLMLFILASMICVSDFGGQFSLALPNSSDHTPPPPPCSEREKYGPYDCGRFIIYYSLLIQFYNHTYGLSGYLLLCKKLL